MNQQHKVFEKPSQQEIRHFQESKATLYILDVLKQRREWLLGNLTVCPKNDLYQMDKEGHVDVVPGVQHYQGATKELDFLVGMCQDLGVYVAADSDEKAMQAKVGKEK